MTQENKGLNIFQKMLKITAELPSVVKGMEVKGVDGKVKYLAVGEKDILDTVKPLEEKYGIYSFPFQREFEKMEYKDRVAVRCKVIYRFINVDNPAEMIDIISYGDGIDTQDKAPGKAMTYADKYALMKAYKISTGEDPDQEASPEVMISEKQLAYLANLLEKSETLKTHIMKHFNVDDIANLTGEQAKVAIDKAKETIAKAMAKEEAKKAAEAAKKAKAKAKEAEKPSKPVKDDTYVDPNTGEVISSEPVKVEEVVLQAPKAEPKVEEVVEEAKTEEKPVKESSPVTETKPVEEAKPVKKAEPKAETNPAEEAKPVAVKANPIQLAKINASMNAERLAKMLAAYKCKKLDELTEVQAKAVLDRLAKEKK